MGAFKPYLLTMHDQIRQGCHIHSRSGFPYKDKTEEKYNIVSL